MILLSSHRGEKRERNRRKRGKKSLPPTKEQFRSGPEDSWPLFSLEFAGMAHSHDQRHLICHQREEEKRKRRRGGERRICGSLGWRVAIKAIAGFPVCLRWLLTPGLLSGLLFCYLLHHHTAARLSRKTTRKQANSCLFKCQSQIMNLYIVLSSFWGGCQSELR